MKLKKQSFAKIGTNYINNYSNNAIEESKFMFHETYCLKFTTKCKECGEVLNIDELEHHNEEFHKLSYECHYCSQMFNNQDIEYHLQFCSERPHNCIYCSLELHPSEVYDHEDLCGSKTEKCLNCEKLIPIKSKYYYNAYLIT